MLGNGAALHAETLSTSKAVLLSQMRTYSTKIQKKCFDPVGADLGSIFMGLGFSPTPGTKLALADATNQDPGGIQCLANGLVLKTHPLADEITQLVEGVSRQGRLAVTTSRVRSLPAQAQGRTASCRRVLRRPTLITAMGP